MTEEQTHKEMNDLYNEVEGLKKVISLMEDIRITDNEIIKLQRKNISHLKMIADDRQVTINQMNQERWSVRKLDEDRVNNSAVGSIQKNFVEDYMDDMDCGDHHWGDVV